MSQRRNKPRCHRPPPSKRFGKQCRVWLEIKSSPASNYQARSGAFLRAIDQRQELLRALKITCPIYERVPLTSDTEANSRMTWTRSHRYATPAKSKGRGWGDAVDLTPAFRKTFPLPDILSPFTSGRSCRPLVSEHGSKEPVLECFLSTLHHAMSQVIAAKGKSTPKRARTLTFGSVGHYSE